MCCNEADTGRKTVPHLAQRLILLEQLLLLGHQGYMFAFEQPVTLLVGLQARGRNEQTRAAGWQRQRRQDPQLKNPAIARA